MNKLPAAPMRPEDEPGYSKEIWQPRWKCYCCHDSGIVQPHLAQIAIADYNYDRDKLPRCQNTGCSAGNHWDGENVIDSVDYRLKPSICQELDSVERESWRKAIEQQHAKLVLRIAEVGCEKNLRMRSRTHEEQQIAQQRHAAVLVNQGIDPQTEFKLYASMEAIA